MKRSNSIAKRLNVTSKKLPNRVAIKSKRRKIAGLGYLTEDEKIVYDTLKDYYDEEEILNIIEDGRYSIYMATDNEELGYYIIDELYGGDFNNLSKDTLKSYFDYESFGRDVQLEGNFFDGDNCMVEVF